MLLVSRSVDHGDVSLDVNGFMWTLNPSLILMMDETHRGIVSNNDYSLGSAALV